MTDGPLYHDVVKDLLDCKLTIHEIVAKHHTSHPIVGSFAASAGVDMTMRGTIMRLHAQQRILDEKLSAAEHQFNSTLNRHSS